MTPIGFITVTVTIAVRTSLPGEPHAVLDSRLKSVKDWFTRHKQDVQDQVAWCDDVDLEYETQCS